MNFSFKYPQPLLKKFFSVLIALVLLISLPGRASALAVLWGTPIIVDYDGDTGLNTSLAVVDGMPAISYIKSFTGGGLQYKRAFNADGTVWSESYSLDTAGGGGDSLAVVNGVPAISYYGEGNNQLKFIRATTASGNSWGTPIVLDTQATWSDAGTSLAIIDGRPAISYYDQSLTALKFIIATDASGTTWNAPQVLDNTENSGLSSSLVMLRDGMPAISYYDYEGKNLKFIRAKNVGGTSWYDPIIIDNLGVIDGNISLAILPDDRPAVSYYDGYNHHLKFVKAQRESGLAWQSPVTLDNSERSGKYSSLFAINQTPAISYSSGFPSNLKLITATDYGAYSWYTPVTLDNSAGAGYYNSLKVVNGALAVSYYESTNGDLKFIRSNGIVDISVLRGATLISSGDTLDFGSTGLHSPATISLTVQNSGTTALDLTQLVLPTGYSFTGTLPTQVAAGSSGTINIRLDALSLGTFTGDLQIGSTDANKSPITIHLTGVVNPLSSEIDITDGGTSVPDSTGSVNFGTTPAGTPLTRTFTVTNSGSDTLNLYSLTLPTGFSLTGTYGNTIAAGGSTTITVRLDAITAATYSGELSLSNSDSDENPYNFTISGVVNAIPAEISVLDGTDVLVDGTSTVSLGSTQVGTPVTHSFTIRNDGSTPLTLGALNLPAGYTQMGSYASTLAVGATTTITVRLNAATAAVYSGEFSLVTNDVDENPFNFTLIGTVADTPADITLLDGTAELTSGVSSVDLGSTTIGTPASHSFTVRNDGSAALSLGTLTLPAGFSQAGSFASSLAGGASTTITVQMNASAAGSPSGTFSLANSDSDENPFTFTINGAVTDTPVEIRVLNGATELSDGSSSVDFGSTVVGTPVTQLFTVRNEGSTTLTLGTLSLPTGFSQVGSFASSLAGYASTTITVRMTALAAGSPSGQFSLANIDADENPFNFTISGTVTDMPAEITVMNGAAELTSGSSSVDFGSTLVGSPVTQSFTIRNEGSAALNLGALSLPAGYTRVGSYAASVAGGGSTTITVRLNASATGTYTGDFSLVSDDADENPFTFTLNGEVTDTYGEIAVFDGSTELIDGAGSIDLGSTPVGTPVSHSFEIRNSGSNPLDLGALSLPMGFSLVGSYDGSVAGGSSTTITVRMDALAAGTYSGAFSLVSDDTDENPFNFTIRGSVTNLTLLTPLIAPVNGSTVLNSSIRVAFNQDVLHDGSAEAANNPANYLLVEQGANHAFDTATCRAGKAGDDVQVTITGVVYDSASYTSIVNTGTLPSGTYQLLVCGTASIEGMTGNVLNNGLSDSSTTFTVVAASSNTGSAGGSSGYKSSTNLPATGFAPGRVTMLPVQPASAVYDDMGSLLLQIPSLKVDVAIVGVPQTTTGWDVTWLNTAEVGWLNGTAFPTWEGNTVLTGHVTDANGNRGPFADLKNLKYGDVILVRGYGETHRYEVRENKLVSPDDTSVISEHEDQSWVTLITCEYYYKETGTYLYRRVIRAELVEIE